MTDKETMKLALEALRMAYELCEGHGVDFKEYGLKFDKDIPAKYDNAIIALKERLAQPEQEPVAWIHTGGHVQVRNPIWADGIADGYTREKGWTPLYTTPPAAPVQEPVAWMNEGWGPDCGPYIEIYRDNEMGWRDRKEWTPLYTSPPQRTEPFFKFRECEDSQAGTVAPPQRTWVGLTEEDLKLLSAEWRIVYGAWIDDFARDIEAKLKEKNT